MAANEIRRLLLSQWNISLAANDLFHWYCSVYFHDVKNPKVKVAYCEDIEESALPLIPHFKSLLQQSAHSNKQKIADQAAEIITTLIHDTAHRILGTPSTRPHTYDSDEASDDDAAPAPQKQKNQLPPHTIQMKEILENIQLTRNTIASLKPNLTPQQQILFR